MTTVADALGAPGPAAGTAGTMKDTESRFLRLLVAQIRHQDPLNPLDNAQFTQQMAQLSTVSGIERLNATLESFAGRMREAQALSAPALIGRQVLVHGRTLALEGGEAVFGVSLAQPAERLHVAISDAAGREVHAMELGVQPAGTVLLAWDGVGDDGTRMPDGTYRFSVRAFSGASAVEAKPLSLERVSAVASTPAGVTLRLASGASVAVGDVDQIM